MSDHPMAVCDRARSSTCRPFCRGLLVSWHTPCRCMRCPPTTRCVMTCWLIRLKCQALPGRVRMWRGGECCRTSVALCAMQAALQASPLLIQTAAQNICTSLNHHPLMTDLYSCTEGVIPRQDIPVFVKVSCSFLMAHTDVLVRAHKSPSPGCSGSISQYDTVPGQCDEKNLADRDLQMQGE